MGARSAAPDLEVLSLDEGGQAQGPARPLPPWTIVFLLLPLAALTIWGLRTRALANRCRALQSAWAEASDLDRSRADQLATLRALAGPQDDDRARLASARLYEEEARRLVATDPAEVALWVRDGALDDLGRAMERYAQRRADELRLGARALRGGDYGPELPAPLSPELRARGKSVDELLARQLGRFRLAFSIPPRRVRLTAADTDLALLRTFVQEPTGSRILAGTDGGMVVLDLDASRSIPLPLYGIEVTKPPLFEPYRVLRGDSVAFVVAYYGAPSVAYARSLRPPGYVNRLGLADVVVPAQPADAVWLSKGSSLTEVRVTDGTVLAGPTTIPAGESVVGGAAGSLFLHTTDGRIVRFDPASGTTTTLASATFTFAAPDGSLTWVTGAGQVHVVRPDGRELTAQLPQPLATTIGPAAWSPDGRTLAAFSGQPDGTWQMQLVDLASGRMSVVADAITSKAPASVVWSADSQRVFWLNGHARQGLATYRLGNSGAEVLRVGTLDIESIVLLP